MNTTAPCGGGLFASAASNARISFSHCVGFGRRRRHRLGQDRTGQTEQQRQPSDVQQNVTSSVNQTYRHVDILDPGCACPSTAEPMGYDDLGLPTVAAIAAVTTIAGERQPGTEPHRERVEVKADAVPAGGH